MYCLANMGLFLLGAYPSDVEIRNNRQENQPSVRRVNRSLMCRAEQLARWAD